MNKLSKLMLTFTLVCGLSACSSTTTSSTSETTASTGYTAGTYTSVQKGNNGDVEVEVTLTSDAIESITVLSHQETEGLGDVAMDEVIASILENQSTLVDTVAGATVSSTAVINAVNDCITQAGGTVAQEETVSSEKATETVSADYVIIGAGPSGLASAIEAAENGLSVIVFEKTTTTGGAAKYGMGPLAIESHIQKEAGDTLTVDEAYNMFMEYTHYRVDGQLVYDYFDQSADTIEWLESMGIQFQEAARYFDKSYPSWHIVESDTGVKGGGQAETMTRKMTEYAQELGVQFYLETPVTSITTDNGVVTGVVAENSTTNTEYVANAKAVLVATGGFGNNVEMLEEELGYVWGEDYFGMQFPGHEGDGINMALEVGAQKGNTNIEMIFNIYANNGPSIGSDLMIMMRQPGLLVNSLGERFFNEEQVQNTTYTGNALVRQPGNTGYMLLDESMINNYLENGVDFESRVYQCDDLSTIFDTYDSMIAEGSVSVFKGSVAEVAEYIGCDEATLQATVDQYNQICEEGHDPFGKSEQYLTPFDGSTIYVAQYFPGSYGTLGGIAVNSNLEVLDNNDQPIVGLYSAGTDSCEIFGDSYMFLLPGNTMGYSINSGRIAAQSVIEFLG